MEPEPNVQGTGLNAPDQAPTSVAENTHIDEGPVTTLTIIYGKNKQEVQRPLGSTVGELKKIIAETTRIEPSGQKLLNKGPSS